MQFLWVQVSFHSTGSANSCCDAASVSNFIPLSWRKSGPSTPVADKHRSVAAEVGVSPGRLTNLQGKFFDQLKQLHKLFERGTLTKEQFEKQKQLILDRLDELASK